MEVERVVSMREALGWRPPDRELPGPEAPRNKEAAEGGGLREEAFALGRGRRAEGFTVGGGIREVDVEDDVSRCDGAGIADEAVFAVCVTRSDVLNVFVGAIRVSTTLSC